MQAEDGLSIEQKQAGFILPCVSKANESVRAVRKIVADTPPPPGVKAYVTGAAALTADQSAAGEKGVILVTMITFAVIIVMLLCATAIAVWTIAESYIRS